MPDMQPASSTQPRFTGQPGRAEHMREAVGLFDDPARMEHAVQELLTEGFDHSDITVLAHERVRARLGHREVDPVRAADDPNAPRRGWVEPESRMQGRGALASVLGYLGAVTALGLTFATGGAAAVAIGAALVGAGGGAAVGTALGRLFDTRLAREMERQIAQGGVLVWVQVRDDECEARAKAALERNGAHHVHAHTVQFKDEPS